PHPPRSASSPYTTLFRSGLAVSHTTALSSPRLSDLFRRFAATQNLPRRQSADVSARWTTRGMRSGTAELNRHGQLREIRSEPDEDRKSTRLNSSHEWISY